ncbi:LPD29 domain-containing protein [Priestia sp. SB1]|uniref:LPD29 domain-containing protein n=1 Tax=Priestia sp. SB1 TaxID=3132359 RepID=UPI003175B306
MTAVLKLNEELNGIELYFESKPQQEVLQTLKANKFRWSGFKKCWYTKQSEKALQVANSLTGNTEEVKTETTPKEIKLHTKKAQPKKKESFNLWNAVQWEELEINQDTKDQGCKEVAKEIRAHIRKRFPQCKFSVTVPYYGKISCDIKSSPYEKGSVYLNAIKEYCNTLLNAYRHCYDPADPYTDYAGSYNFYGRVEISWEYSQTEVTEEIKKDVISFDSKLEEKENADYEKRQQEIKEWEKQRELEAAEFKKQQEEENKVIENIYNSIEVKSLDENEQYFAIGSEFADLNKNNTIEQYFEEVEKGRYSLDNVKITKEVHFSNLESLESFSNMLLNDFDFLTETGGSYTDDNRLNSMTDYYNMDDLEKSTVKWNRKGVAIYFNNELQFIVDAQGYSYARYVGLTDNVTIEKTFEYEQLLSDEEVAELKHQADVLEDISTDVISELNIFDTWKDENWKEYRETFKEKLINYEIKLTKGIIQQIEIEDLKVCMYKVLTEVDGIQEQFKNADIQQGEKVTLFYISDWGSIVTSRVTFDEAVPAKYAQYDNAVKLTFTPEKKRKLHYKYFYSTLLVYKGSHSLPDTVLNHVEESNGMRVTRSKYGSCDNKQYDEIMSYFEQQGIKPVINTYKPQL